MSIEKTINCLFCIFICINFVCLIKLNWLMYCTWLCLFRCDSEMNWKLSTNVLLYIKVADKDYQDLRYVTFNNLNQKMMSRIFLVSIERYYHQIFVLWVIRFGSSNISFEWGISTTHRSKIINCKCFSYRKSCNIFK